MNTTKSETIILVSIMIIAIGIGIIFNHKDKEVENIYNECVNSLQYDKFQCYSIMYGDK